MNQHDSDNLEFLKSLSEESLKLWFEQASDDDIQYASELLDAWEKEMMTMEMEVLQEKFEPCMVSSIQSNSLQ